MGMEEEGGSAWQQGKGGGTQRGESEGRVGGAGSKQGKLRDGVKEGEPGISNHFGTLGRRGCPGGTKSLGCSLWVPDLCQARMVWQRGKQLLPSASSPAPPPSRVLL